MHWFPKSDYLMNSEKTHQTEHQNLKFQFISVNKTLSMVLFTLFFRLYFRCFYLVCLLVSGLFPILSVGMQCQMAGQQMKNKSGKDLEGYNPDLILVEVLSWQFPGRAEENL